MFQLALAFVVSTLGLLAYIEWRKSLAAHANTLSREHAKVAQHLALSRWKEAEKLLAKLQRKKKITPETSALTARLLRKTGKAKEAGAILSAALDLYPESLLLHKERGKLLLAWNNPQEALSSLKKALPLLRDEEDFLSLANAHYHFGEVMRAWEIITPFLKTSCSGQLLALAGDCCFSRSDFGQALRYYRAAQQGGTSNQQLLSRMGHSLRRLGKFQDAERCFETILQKDPAHIQATLSLGACLEAQGLYARALLVYQSGKAWEASDMRILRQAGICSVHTERFAYAELYLTEAVMRGAENVQTLAYLAYALERLEKWREAETVYLRITREAPEHVAGYRGAAWLFGVGLSTKMTAEQALKFAQKSLEIIPDAISWEALSACEARAGNFSEAHQIQEALSSQDRDKSSLQRRQRAMRALRRGQPLDEHLVARSLVA